MARRSRRSSCAAMFSLAAAVALAAPTVRAADLTLYWGNGGGGPNNGVFVGSQMLKGGSSQGGISNGGSGPTQVDITPGTTASPTITVPVGDYLSIAVDAVLTNNPNPDAGYTASGSQPAAPANLGLESLALAVRSSDSTGAMLAPVAASSKPEVQIGSTTYYDSTATVQQKYYPNGGNSVGTPPSWSSFTTAGDFADGSGSVGIEDAIIGTNTNGSEGLTSSDIAQLTDFAPQGSDTSANYTNATDFFDSLIFQGDSPGSVTLSPYVYTGGTSAYWTLSTQGSVDGGVDGYRADPFSFDFEDTITTPPPLVIDVIAVPEPVCIGVVAATGIATALRRPRPRVRVPLRDQATPAP